ncbi:MAG: hypothetical protein HFH45_03895 [Bacilli bacterium]|nr:hypothetical protein [Bacilli bacterium]
MANKEVNDISDFEQIVRENIKGILVQLVLCFYHRFNYLEESYDQIFNTIVDYLILPQKDIDLLHDIVLDELENKYYYKMRQNEPVKFESIL